jgi:hypothetical protein
MGSPSLFERYNDVLTNDKLDAIIKGYSEKESTIRSVRLPWCRMITVEGLGFLRNLPLYTLDLRNNIHLLIDDWTFLTGMPLKTLLLEGIATLSDENLENIVILVPKLEHLNLMITGISNRGIEIISKLPLKRLQLGYIDAITEEGIKHLAQIPTLTSLYLRGLKNVSETSLEFLSDLPLQTLHLESHNETPMAFIDEIFNYLTKMPLEHLILRSNSKITEDCLPQLIKHPLKTLDLRKTNISTSYDNWIKRNIPTLEKLNGLRVK